MARGTGPTYRFQRILITLVSVSLMAPGADAGPGGPRERVRNAREFSPRNWESIIKEVENARKSSKEATSSFAGAMGIDMSTEVGRKEWDRFRAQVLSLDGLGNLKSTRTLVNSSNDAGVSEGTRANREALRKLMEMSRSEQRSSEELKLVSGILVTYARLIRSTRSGNDLREYSPVAILDIISKGTQKDTQDLLVLLDTAARYAEYNRRRQAMANAVEQVKAEQQKEIEDGKAQTEAAKSGRKTHLDQLNAQIRQLNDTIALLGKNKAQAENVNKMRARKTELENELSTLTIEGLETGPAQETKAPSLLSGLRNARKQGALSLDTVDPEISMVEALVYASERKQGDGTKLRTFEDIRARSKNEHLGRLEEQSFFGFEKLDPDKRTAIETAFVEEMNKTYLGLDSLKGDVAAALFSQVSTMRHRSRPRLNILMLGTSGGGKSYFPERVAWSILFAVAKSGGKVGVGGKVFELNDSKDAKEGKVFSKSSETIRKFSIHELLEMIDGGNFQSMHEIAKLIGAPPGYAGFEKTQRPKLNNDRLRDITIEWDVHGRKGKTKIIVFDEIEKAHQSLRFASYPLLDAGYFEVYEGQKVTRLDFRDAIVTTTGNVGSKEVGADYAKVVARMKTGNIPRSSIGEVMKFLEERVDDEFKTQKLRGVEDKLRRSEAFVEQEIQEITDSFVKKAANQTRTNSHGMPETDPVFPTAWVGRFDKIVGVRAMDVSEYMSIVKFNTLNWVETHANLSEELGVKGHFVKLLPSAMLAFAKSVSPDLGKRHLVTMFNLHVVFPMEHLYLTGQIKPGDSVIVSLHPDSKPGEMNPKFEFFRVPDHEQNSNQTIVNMASDYYGTGSYRQLKARPPQLRPALSTRLRKRIEVSDYGKWLRRKPSPPSDIAGAEPYGSANVHATTITPAEANAIEARDRARIRGQNE